MDLIKIALKKITIGHVTSMFGIVVMRRGHDSFLIGETINIKHAGMKIDAAARGIYELSRA